MHDDDDEKGSRSARECEFAAHNMRWAYWGEPLTPNQ
jgi:hypothetical protein